MVRASTIIGALLVALGVGAYYGTSRASLTALIPAAFGLPILVLGIAALGQRFRKHAMHAATLLTVVGFLVTISGLVDLLQMVLAQPALLAKSAMAILCGTHAGLSLKSFIDARRRKPTSPAP